MGSSCNSSLSTEKYMLSRKGYCVQGDVSRWELGRISRIQGITQRSSYPTFGAEGIRQRFQTLMSPNDLCNEHNAYISE
jgi:hypothetical protein